MSGWVERVCAIVSSWRTSDDSILRLFHAAAPVLSNRHVFLDAVADQLRAHPELIEQWAGYSADKRNGPNPYFERQPAPDGSVACEVGFFAWDNRRMDVTRYADAALACADYLYREAVWVLRQERFS